MNADSYGLKLNEQSSEQTVYDYNMLMSAMNVSVSKHLMDENFTVVWANDYFYSQTLYTKQEYEAIYHNSCRKYFEQYPEEYEKMAMVVEQALLKGKSGYECICRMPRKDGSCSWIKVSGMFSDQKVNDTRSFTLPLLMLLKPLNKRNCSSSWKNVHRSCRRHCRRQKSLTVKNLIFFPGCRMISGRR